MHSRLKNSIALTTLFFGSATLPAQEPPASADWMNYSGSAFDLDDHKLVYTEVHYLALDGDDVRERLVLYRCPNGSAFARKRVSRSRLPSVPDFELEDARVDYAEGLSVGADKVEVHVREPGDKQVKRETLADVPTDLVADAGFDVFVRDHWDEMVAGETVHFNFLVPSRLDSLGFKVRQVGEETIDGHPARTFRLALGGLLGLVVSGIDVSYDAKTHTILRFSGLSNVRAPDGDNHVVRIDFPGDARVGQEGPESMEVARVEPLVKSCGKG